MPLSILGTALSSSPFSDGEVVLNQPYPWSRPSGRYHSLPLVPALHLAVQSDFVTEDGYLNSFGLDFRMSLQSILNLALDVGDPHRGLDCDIVDHAGDAAGLAEHSRRRSSENTTELHPLVSPVPYGR